MKMNKTPKIQNRLVQLIKIVYFGQHSFSYPSKLGAMSAINCMAEPMPITDLCQPGHLSSLISLCCDLYELILLADYKDFDQIT